ncbi:hypothetical protein HMJ29_05815 [Hymenobacter taeanensis]|uniref:Uncharacterized protein n=1 Tax=Hymenobacter taeanensis TaxID=2735321 RepID=A0A6M6BE31_9BACT|nr:MULTISPECIES: hypothetical protein [Hymenobacter]QJX46477.1 hypothetical protein HMJ29_05815 [Hymenobacter taeanensis]UOQ80340.1 hypothetical protein MUN83_16135 [Hymenobacter sp. 5414T-23]
MPASLLSSRLLLLLLTLLFSSTLHAQQQSTRPLIISPVVGPIIDGSEKARYNLFPFYSSKEFKEAAFEQSLTPDSTITLRTTLVDGRILLRPIPHYEYLNTRRQIEEQAQALRPAAGASPDSVGGSYRVTLRSGSTFAGVLRATRPQELEFSTQEPEAVIIPRSQIIRMELIPKVELDDAMRHPTWGYVGNGTRVFFAPTARGLRAGEGYFQIIDLFMLGLNYGITDNVSVGILASAVPGAGLDNQLVALTPKVSYPISNKLSVGAGVLYARIPTFDSYGSSSGYGAGVAYGLLTTGSADNNFTVGLGYGFSGGRGEQGFGKSPVAVISGATRVSKRISLMSENYLITSGSGGLAGLYGMRLNWPRTTLGIGSFYVAPFEGDGVFGYIYPAYIDLSLRFGKTAQK